MTKLLNESQTFDSILKEKKLETNVAKENALKAQSSSKNNKRKKKMGGKGKLIGGGKFKRKKNNRDNSKKLKGKCFHCSIDRHEKKNCKKYLQKLKEKNKDKFGLLVLKAFLMVDDLSS